MTTRVGKLLEDGVANLCSTVRGALNRIMKPLVEDRLVGKLGMNGVPNFASYFKMVRVYCDDNILTVYFPRRADFMSSGVHDHGRAEDHADNEFSKVVSDSIKELESFLKQSNVNIEDIDFESETNSVTIVVRN